MTSRPFLVHEASAETAQQLSRGGSAAVARPEDVEQGRSSNLQAGGLKLSAEQPSSKVRKKMSRQADSQDSQDSGGFNDLLSGLLNVVGEGIL